MRSVHTEASTQDQSRSFPVSAPCVAKAGTAGAFSCLVMDLAHPPSCPPSLSAALLSALPAAHHRCSTTRALTPARRSHVRQASPLTPFCLPGIQPPTTSCARTSLNVTSARPTGPFPGPGFAVTLAGSPLHAAETSSSSCRLPVRLRLLPTPSAPAYSHRRGDAVTFGCMCRDITWQRLPLR